MKPPSAGSGAHKYQQTHTNTNHTNTTQDHMKYTKILFLSAIPMLIVIILGVALKAPWWQVLIAALVVDLATDLTIIWNIRRDNPVCKADDWWDRLPFDTLEKITGLNKSEFDPEDDSQAFVDACDQWWYEKTEEQRLEIWKEYR